MQRVRIGVTGLAAVFLLVVLAAAVIGTLHRDTSAHAPVTAGQARTVAEAPKEPLAELGVAPGNAQPTGTDSNVAAPAPAPAPAATPVPAPASPPATDPSVAAAPAPAARPR